MKQAEIIKNMSDDELKKQLLLSQSIFFILSLILSYFLFSNFSDWFHYLIIDVKQIFFYGFLSALIIVMLEILLSLFLPSQYFDDGGINEKVFKNQSEGNIFLISAVVAI